MQYFFSSGFFSVRLSEQRFEKEMLIEDLKRIEEKVSSIEHAFDSHEELDISVVSGDISFVRHLLDRFKYDRCADEGANEHQIEESKKAPPIRTPLKGTKNILEKNSCK